MNKERVNISQLSLLLLIIFSGGKFLSLPSILAGDVGHDSWLVLCFAFLWDGICLGFFAWAVKINKDHKLSIERILSTTLSRVVSKIIFAIFFLLFICRCTVLLNSCYKMFAVTFDVSTNWIMFVLPIVLVGFFAISRGFNSIARMGQLLCVLIVLCMLALLSFTLVQTDFGTILPIGEAGWDNIIKTSFLRGFWFSDYIFMYFVMDNICVKKRVFAPLFTCFFIGALIAVLMNIVFVALFGTLAPDIKLAMSKISVFSVSETTNGRWDWLTLSVWIMSVLIKIVVFIYCAYKCIEKLFCLHFTKPNIVAIAVIFLCLMVPLFVPVDRVIQSSLIWLIIPFSLVQYALPISFPLLTKASIKKLNLEVSNE